MPAPLKTLALVDFLTEAAQKTIVAEVEIPMVLHFMDSDAAVFSRCFFGHTRNYLPDVGIHFASHSILEFSECAKTDIQVADFKVFQASYANNILHFRMYAPPFLDRDFVSFHLLARLTGGRRGFMFRMRQVEDRIVPVYRQYVVVIALRV